MVKKITCQRRKRKRHRFHPWVGKIPWSGKWQPTPVFLRGKSHGQRSLVGYSPWGRKESDVTEHAFIHMHSATSHMFTELSTYSIISTAQALASWPMFQKFQKVTATETALLSGKTYLVLKHLHINRQSRGWAPLSARSGAGAETSFLPVSHLAFFKPQPPITVWMDKQEGNSKPGFLLTY